MDFPINYELGMTPEEIKRFWPNLNSDDFHFTSLKTVSYNCLNWAIGSNDTWMDMWYFQNVHELNPEELDHSAKGYAECLEKYYGFEICEDGTLEDGFEKVALYEDINKDWSHISRQCKNGNWTSKMGKLEDIEHYNLEGLSGKLYGTPKIFMRRKIASLSSTSY